jgi:nucleoside-diphosphate-sugar epimerase
MVDLKPDPNRLSFQSKSRVTVVVLDLMIRETPVMAETSYGCQKQIIELYTYDYGRKGFLETRSVRLPTVAIRSGAVSLTIYSSSYPRRRVELGTDK